MTEDWLPDSSPGRSRRKSTKRTHSERPAKRRSHSKPKTSGKRRGHHFTRASALASMRHCAKCDRTIFGGDKGLATHRRKKHRGKK